MAIEVSRRKCLMSNFKIGAYKKVIRRCAELQEKEETEWESCNLRKYYAYKGLGIDKQPVLRLKA